MMLLVAVFITGCDAKDSNDNYEGTYQLYSIVTDKISDNAKSYYLIKNGYYIHYISTSSEPVEIKLDKIIKNENGHYSYDSDYKQIPTMYIFEYKDMGDGYIYILNYNSSPFLLKYTDDALLYIQKETYQYFKKID